MQRESLCNYQVEIDKDATSKWYRESDGWGCECGHCRNFLKLAKTKKLPLYITQILNELDIPPEKATYVGELYTETEKEDRMSVCLLIASDMPLAEFAPPRDYPLHMDVDCGTIYDGGADDNYFLNIFADAADYTDKKYAVSLEWNYTEGRARQIIEYIRTALQETDTVEFWRVWLMGYYEFEDRPFIYGSPAPFLSLSVSSREYISDSAIDPLGDAASRIPRGFLSCGLRSAAMGFVGFPIGAILQWEQIH